MVLVKIFNLVVDKDWWLQICIHPYRDRALGSCIDRFIDATLGVRVVERVVLYNSFKNLIGHILDMKTYEDRGSVVRHSINEERQKGSKEIYHFNEAHFNFKTMTQFALTRWNENGSKNQKPSNNPPWIQNRIPSLHTLLAESCIKRSPSLLGQRGHVILVKFTHGFSWVDFYEERTTNCACSSLDFGVPVPHGIKE
jgi:hypothetical protein